MSLYSGIIRAGFVWLLFFWLNIAKGMKNVPQDTGITTDSMFNIGETIEGEQKTEPLDGQSAGEETPGYDPVPAGRQAYPPPLEASSLAEVSPPLEASSPTNVSSPLEVSPPTDAAPRLPFSADLPYAHYPFPSGYAHDPYAANAKGGGAPGKHIALTACLASALGFAALGVGLNFGGVLASRFAPAKEAVNIENAQTRQEVVYAYAQPIVEYSVAQHIPGSKNVSGIVKQVSDAVVSINLSVSVPNFFNQMTEHPGAGSGIIFSEDNEKVYIATNNHVIQSADKVSISVDDKVQISANFVGSDPQSDLAVISVKKLEVEGAGLQYKLAEFGDSSQLEVGDDVVAIGNAMGEGKTATSGIISAINKQITIDGKTLDVIQTDAAINPGNSGGALANSSGEIIGINTAKLSSSKVEGMGYSIPSNIAKAIINDLKSNGSVKKPYLGIHGMSITEELKNIYNFPSLGVYVDTVTDGGAAEQAGIEPTDIIVGFNEKPISTIDELSAAIAGAKVGDKALISIYRRGSHPMQFEAVLGNLNPDAKF